MHEINIKWVHKKIGEKTMKNKKTLKFYMAIFIAKCASFTLKLLKRNATYMPGKIALQLCPDFLGMLEKPETIIGVTGTNGKTTVCNMINDILTENKYDFINNKYGSNIDGGIATTLIQGSTMLGKAKKKLAVLEIDERSANKIYPYITPTYLVCTNLFRDSLMRNAHTEFISEILTKYIPKETTLILNGDDLITSNIAPENKRMYFGIDRLDTDGTECENIARDIIVCPKCNSKLVYDYVRYNHLGKAHCPNCDFGTPDIDYLVTNLDLKNRKMTLHCNDKDEVYDLISDNIINIYNILTVIVVLKQIGLEPEKINESLKKQKIVDTRYSEEVVNGIKVVTHLSKGMNPIACSRVFDYVRKYEGNKAVILLLDDLHEEASGSENTAWQYDTDYEFLNDDSIKQVIIAGVRYLDGYVRLQIAGVDPTKIVHERDELSAVEKLKLDDIQTVFILHDLYSIELKERVKNKVEVIIKSGVGK